MGEHSPPSGFLCGEETAGMSSERDFQKAYARVNADSLDGLDGLDAFSLKLPDAHKFPTEALPRPCANLVREAAAAIGCPPELVALPMLVTLGAAIGNARRVVVKSGWEESAALFGAIVAPPGGKKTPATTEATRPTFKAQVDLQHKYAAEADEYERELREHEVDRKDAAKNGLTAPPPPKPPVMGRTLVADTTIEALVDILADNPRGILVERDELAGWVRGMDQYRSGG